MRSKERVQRERLQRERLQKKGLRRALACLLLFSMVFGLASCGKKGGTDANKKTEQTEELAPDFVYVADYIEMGEDQSFYNVQFLKNQVYSLVGDYDPEAGAYRQMLKRYELDGGTIGEGEEVLQIPNEMNVSQFCVTTQGDIYLTAGVYPQQDEEENFSERNGQSYFLIKYDAGGAKVFETDLSSLAEGQDWFYVQNLVVDDQNRIYLYCNEEIVLYNEKGESAGKVSLGTISWLNGMGTARDGKVYISYYRYDSNSGGYGLSEVDFDNRKLGASYDNFIGGNSGFSRSVTGDILISDSGALYDYSLSEQKATRILTWLDCDINGDYVNGFSMAEDGKVTVLIRDWETGGAELAVMKKVKADEVVKKETITIGLLYTDSRISRQVVEFNKSTDQYRVTVKTYMDQNNWSDTSYDDAIAKLTNDITSGNGPDILDISDMDIANFTRKGVIEDLTPYLDKSTVLKKSDFFDKVLDECTYDGVLAYIPTSFSLMTLAAKTSEVGDKMGWTLQDLIAYSDRHPGAELLEGADKGSILSIMLMLNQSRYIDEANGKCDLNSQDFKDLLMFANRFPDDLENSDGRPAPYKLADGSLLLSDAGIYSFSDIQTVQAYFGNEDVTFIGFPTYDGGNGCMMSFGNAYAISSQSKCKEGAWMFLEKMIAKDVADDWSFWGFSTRKELYQKQKDAATEIRYIYDENGDPWLDENGDPVIAGSGGGYSIMGDDGEVWSFETHVVTKEEADMVDQLLEGAICFSYHYDQKLMDIIGEVAQVYFKGDQSVDEVADILQNRVTLYLRENLE